MQDMQELFIKSYINIQQTKTDWRIVYSKPKPRMTQKLDEPSSTPREKIKFPLIGACALKQGYIAIARAQVFPCSCVLWKTEKIKPV
jgi:hypothetical protein